MKNPHWLITTGIGAIIGYLLPYCIKMIKYLFSLKKVMSILQDYLGEWHIYTCSRKGNKCMWTKSELTIKYTLFGMQLKCLDPDIHRTYTGSASFEGNYMLMKFVSPKLGKDGFKETVFHRYELSSPSSGSEKIFGIHLSCDYNLCVTSGSVILSRFELSDEELEKQTALYGASAEPVLFIKKT